jgi:hypothetical protein
MRPNQEQSGGDGAVNAQAGRDVVVNGITASDALEIADGVFWKNFLTMSGAAEDVLRVRVERIIHDFVQKLQAENPAGLSSMNDPDMLRTLYAAEEGYACSGEDDLEEALLDLLLDRAGQTERDLKTLVLNQAVSTLPKLSKQQRAILAVLFFTDNPSYAGPFNLESFYGYVADCLVPFVELLPEKSSEIGYMAYTGVGSIAAGSITLEDMFYRSEYGFFTNGFTREGTDAAHRLPNPIAEPGWVPFLADSDIFIPCVRNSEKLQINARSLSGVQELAHAKNIPTLVTHQDTGRMQEPEIKADLITRFPAMEKLFDKWDSLGLCRFDLTTVGIAIGHACQRKVVGSAASTPLEAFLT